jgi:hypothetical protein
MVNIQMLYGPYASRLFQFKKMKQTHNTLLFLGKYHYAFTYAFQGRRMLTEIYALDSTP